MTNKEGHYKLWDELARTGGGNKLTAYRHIFGVNTLVPVDYCFACQECNDRGDERHCTECPLSPDDPCLDGLFDEWCDADTPEERKRLAAIIRDLPWREK
jgi:hypothetical protein